MSGLLSDAELGSLQDIALLGMQSTCTIWDYDQVETVNGKEHTWVARSSTVQCWLYSTPSPTIQIISGAQGLVNTYRLYLPVGTDIATGDRVEVGGGMYTVSDTTSENTWQALLTVSLRRVE